MWRRSCERRFFLPGCGRAGRTPSSPFGFTLQEGGTVIAVVQGDKAAQKPVKARLRDGGLVEVEGEGLSEGMTVVTTGAYGLPKETKVRVLGGETDKNAPHE